MARQVGKEQFSINSLGIGQFRVQWLFDTRSEAIVGVPFFYEGFRLENASGMQWTTKEGKWTMDAVYVGLTKEPSEEQDDTSITKVEIIKKIESFPDRELLKTEFGAYVDENDRLRFPEFLPKPPLGTTGLDPGRGGTEIPNPMFNFTTYPVEVNRATWRLVRKRVPATIRKISRTVIKTLPSVFKDDTPVDQWYVHPYEVRRRGEMVEITVEFEEAGPEFDAYAVRVLAQKARKRGLVTTGLVTTGL